MQTGNRVANLCQHAAQLKSIWNTHSSGISCGNIRLNWTVAFGIQSIHIAHAIGTEDNIVDFSTVCSRLFADNERGLFEERTGRGDTLQTYAAAHGQSDGRQIQGQGGTIEWHTSYIQFGASAHFSAPLPCAL